MAIQSPQTMIQFMDVDFDASYKNVWLFEGATADEKRQNRDSAFSTIVDNRGMKLTDFVYQSVGTSINSFLRECSFF